MPTIAEVFDAIAKDVAAAHEKVGDDLVDTIRAKVSVPVEYVTGPRGGRRVIRSRPGEPPRKETGELQASIHAETVAPADLIETAITVEAPYAVLLQEDLNRPITDEELDAVERLLVDAVADAING